MSHLSAHPRDRAGRILDEARGVEGQTITSWERTFLDSISTQHNLTPKQEKILQGIEAKVFGEDDDE